MAARFKDQAASSSRRLVEVEAALKSKRAALVIKKVELFKSQKVVATATALISWKEMELNTARVALAIVDAKALVDVDASRAKCKVAVEAEMAAI